jgi:hypothetical protein
MPYIDAIKGSIVAFVIFVLVAFFVSGGNPSSSEIQLILTISTFLFAIVVGFYLSRYNTRYDTMRDLISSEDALFLTLFETVAFLGKKYQDAFRELIDKYYMIAFDFPLGEYYKHNAMYVHLMYEELNKITDFSNEKAKDVFDDILGLLRDIEHNRNTSSVLSQERITKGQWTILLLLGGIVLFSIFFLKTDVLHSQIVTVLLATVLVLILLVIRDLQNFRLGGKELVGESGQEVFESIGKLRYHNRRYVEEGIVSVPEYIKEYRLGVHEPGSEPRIEIVKRD